MIYVAKIDNGYAKIYNASNGCYARTVGDKGAVSAVVQADTVAVTYSDGKVKIYNANTGCYMRTI